MSVKISVITATYNSARTIRHTCESIRSQNYPDLEHIIVDGCSTDGTLAQISKYAGDDARVHSQRDTGIYDALNRGINLASGDIVGFLHSDDFFPSSDVLEEVARAFEDPSIDMCFGDLAYVAALDTRRVIRRWRSGDFSRSKLKYGWMPPHPTLYVRRKILREHQFNLDYRISADYDAILRLLINEKFKVVYLQKELVHMRVGGASNKSVKNLLRKMKEDARVLNSNKIGGWGTLLAKNLRKLPQFFII